jgi:tetratricopeptide (TPR) repeat protein
VLALKDKVFVVPGAATACAQGGCAAKLTLWTEPGANHGGHRENTMMAALRVSVARDIPAPEPVVSKHWQVYFDSAFAALSARRMDEAETLFAKALAFVDENLGVDHPAAARVLYQSAVTNEIKGGKPAEREAALKRALAILEKYPDRDVQAVVGTNGGPLDKERVARRLADGYWDQRKYAEAYDYYDRAYKAVADVGSDETTRNLRLALDSAGIMATACTLGKWDIAERAMAELKQRAPKVTSESKGKLQYFIDTGEPRLAARKC